jgi:hypothetical protein
MFKRDNIPSPSGREEEEVRCSAPPLVEEKTPLPSSDKEGNGQEGDPISLL